MRWIPLSLSVVASLAFADDFGGRVVSVVDGSTVVVVDASQKRQKVMLAGVAAPRFGQPFHDEATASLSALAFNRDVELKGMRVDGLGNRVATLMVAEPRCNAPSCPKTGDAGLVQISVGMAWWHRQYGWTQTQQQREDYEVAEFRAKSRRLGLWRDKNPVPPWDWLRALGTPGRDRLLK